MENYLPDLIHFGVNVTFSMVVYFLFYLAFLKKQAEKWPLKNILILILLLHGTRANGMGFIIEGVSNGLDPAMSFQAAYGDLVAAFLALVAAFLLIKEHQGAKLMIWLFSIVGLIDFANVAFLVAYHQIDPSALGSVYYIVCAIVPAMLLSHIWVIDLLRKRGKEIEFG